MKTVLIPTSSVPTPPPPPPYESSFCYWKCYGTDEVGIKTVFMYSDTSYFSKGTCAPSTVVGGGAYKCGGAGCKEGNACQVTPPPPPPPSPLPSPPGADDPAQTKSPPPPSPPGAGMGRRLEELDLEKIPSRFADAGVLSR